LKGAGALWGVWGITFYFVWFSVISNTEDVQKMIGSYGFNFVSSAVFMVPMFFYISGFLQTFSFLQKEDEKQSKGVSMYSPKHLAGFYLLKIFRYLPLNMVMLLAAVYIMPYVGSGPIWNNYLDMTQTCKSNWWTNLIWINNLYPAEFNDKCLAWTWFVPCYVQLTLLIPILLLIPKLKGPQNSSLTAIYFLVIYFASLGGSFAWAYSKNLGGTMVGTT